jgi:hypothetical protein
MHFYDAMKTIHYLGNQVLLTLSTISYWKLFEATIARNSLTNKRDLNEEDIFIKLLEIIVKKEPNKDVFLEKLLEKVQKKELTYIEFLYDRINGDNFVKFTKIIFEAWKKSKFITPTDEIYPKQNTFGPLFLPYESEKILGFYFSNASVSFVKNTINVDFETGKHEKRDKIDRFGEASKVEIIDHYTYNPFYPIYIKDLESQETEIKFEKIIPSFFLKVNKDKEFWHNVVKTGEYAIDVATTLSGVGNIAKFRHLVRLGEIGGVVAKMRLLAGVVEITSGVTNTMLKLTGFEDTESGQALQQYLFWLELLSLSGEIGLGVKNVITKNLQRSANEIIGKSENAAKFEKELDNLVEEGKISRKEADEVIEHFEEMVEVERKLGDLIIHESNKSDDISENFFKNIVKQVRESTGLNDFDINLIDRNNEKYQKLFEQWQKGGGYGFFKPTSGPIKVYNGIPGEGKQIYMFAGKTLNRWGEAKFIEFTKYTLQHELFHVEMFMYLKNQTINYMKYWNEIPTYMHEQYVLNRLLKTKNWKQADLIIDLKNINTMRTELKLPEISLDELKNWKFEIELDKIGIKIK